MRTAIALLAAVSAAVLALGAELGRGQHSPARFELSPGLTVQQPGRWRSVHTGIELRRVTLERADPPQGIDLVLLRLDSRRVTPRVLHGADFGLNGSDAKTFAEKSRAAVTINANYFDENGRPLGFLKTASGGNRQVSKSSLFTGIFGVKNNAPFIVHRDEFAADAADEGLQAGPLLINKGVALNVTRGAGRQSRRSLIGIDKDRRIILAVTDGLFGGLSWVELQQFFGAPTWHAQVVDLLNLDGGGSAQLYLKAGRTEQHVSGNTEVPVALGFFTR